MKENERGGRKSIKRNSKLHGEGKRCGVGAKETLRDRRTRSNLKEWPGVRILRKRKGDIGRGEGKKE